MIMYFELLFTATLGAITPLPWERTSSDNLTSLTVADNCSYSLKFAGLVLTGTAPVGVDPALSATSQGTDAALGPYDELSLVATGRGSFAVRFY